MEAIKAIHFYTEGNPRLINTTCDNALLEGFLRRQAIIDRKLIEHVAEELDLGSIKDARRREEERRIEQTMIPPDVEGLDADETSEPTRTQTSARVTNPDEGDESRELFSNQPYTGEPVDGEGSARGEEEVPPPGPADPTDSKRYFASLNKSMNNTLSPSDTMTFIPKASMEDEDALDRDTE